VNFFGAVVFGINRPISQDGAAQIATLLHWGQGIPMPTLDSATLDFVLET